MGPVKLMIELSQAAEAGCFKRGRYQKKFGSLYTVP